VLKYYHTDMRTILFLLIVLTTIIISFPAGAEVDRNSSSPCVVMGVDVCEKPAPIIPIHVDVSCTINSALAIPFVHDENYLEFLFPGKTPFILSLRKDKPPRV